MNQYDVVVASNTMELVFAVNDRMKSGFMPIGRVAVLAEEGLVAQAMLKSSGPVVSAPDFAKTGIRSV